MTGRMERVKAALRKGEVCSFADLYSNFLSNGRNDISKLKREGWYIETTFTKHAAGGTSHCHYKLVREPKPEQLAIV
jgi:hypothetical protein